MKVHDLGDSMPAVRRSTQPDAPASLTYRLTSGDVLETLPYEYRSAKGTALFMSAASAVVRSRSSLLMMGTPGIGKTFQLHGLLRNDRMNRSKKLIETGERINPVWDCGRYRFEPHESDWKRLRLAKICANDSIRIISESSDIRRFRYDREQLDAWGSFPGVLAVDDIGFVEPNEWVRDAVYEIATRRRRDGLATIWTTNMTADELRQAFGGAIASRLHGGTVLVLDGEDRRL